MPEYTTEEHARFAEIRQQLREAGLPRRETPGADRARDGAPDRPRHSAATQWRRVMETPSIGDIIRDTAERGMSELLIAVADYFYCLGAGIIPPPAIQRGRAELLTTIEHLHRVEVLGPRGWLDPPVANDDLPGWYLAHCERQNALGDAEPMEGLS